MGVRARAIATMAAFVGLAACAAVTSLDDYVILDDPLPGAAPSGDGSPPTPVDAGATDRARDGGSTVSDAAAFDSEVSDAPAPRDAVAVDAPPDGPPPPKCTLALDHSFSTGLEGWEAVGKARFDDGAAQLIEGKSAADIGAVWWRTPLEIPGSLRIEVDYAMEPTVATPGEGLTIAWVEGPYGLGAAGQSFGLCGGGMKGTGLALDYRHKQLIALSSIESDCGTVGGILEVDPATSAHATMTLGQSSIRGSLRNVAGDVSRTNMSIPKKGYLGFTASTGPDFRARFAIRHVQVYACP